MSNRINPDKTAHYEPSHLDLCCLHKPIIIAMKAVVVKELIIGMNFCLLYFSNRSIGIITFVNLRLFLSPSIVLKISKCNFGLKIFLLYIITITVIVCVY